MKLRKVFSPRSGLAAALGLSLLLSSAAARAQSNDATLSYMFTSEGTLTPVFTSSTLSYTASVPGTTTSIMVTPYATDYYATVTVNGTPVTYGYSSAPISLSPGPTLITTRVVSADATATNTYTLTVTREVPSSNAALASLVPSAGTLTPAFASGTTNYTATVLYGTTSMTVTPTAADAGATITVNGTPVTSGSPSSPINLSAGPNTITTVVTASDATTTQTYTLTVTPAATPVPLFWDVNGTTAGFSTVVGAWDGVNALWNTDPTGGSDGTTTSATTASDDLIIPAATANTGKITLSGTQSAGALTFSNTLGAVTLTGGTLALGASPTITVDSAAATVQSIASTMSGADTSFTKEGVGTLALTYTANTFNPGQIAINNGILRIGNNTATTLNSGSYAGNISIANGATLQLWSTSAQTLSGNISGAGGLNKAYGGTLTLSGANTYTGLTTVSAGTLASSGSFSGPVTVASGAALSPGASAGAVGTMTISDATASALTINTNSQLYFDLPASGTTCDLVAVTGNLVLNGNSTLILNAPGGLAAGNTYTLMTYAAKTGSGSIVFQNGSTTMGNLTLTVGATSVTLAVGAGGMNNLVWKGNVAGSTNIWDTTTPNWTKNLTPLQAYTEGDFVTFDDSATTTTVTNATTVTPGLVTVTNSVKDYTISASIGGSGALLKSGSKMLILTGSNTFSGGVFINTGTIRLTTGSTAASVGDPANVVTFTGSSTFDVQQVNPTLSQGFVVNEGVTASFAGNHGRNVTINTALTGSGTVQVRGSGNLTYDFRSANNTFSGDLTISAGTAGYIGELRMNSLADTSGRRVKLGAQSPVTEGVFTYGTGAVVPLVLNQRQIELSGTTAGGTFNNNATTANTAVTINTDLLVTGAGNKTFTLGGSNTNDNQFAGIIADGTIGGTNYVISLTKTGTGTWILGNDNNSYTGPTTVSGGILAVNNLANGGSPSAIGQSLSTYTKLVLKGGTLQYLPCGDVGAGAQDTDRNFAIVANSGVDASGTGALNFTQTDVISPDVTDLTGDTTSGQKTIKNLSSTANLLVGMRVTGSGIGANAVISTIDSATQVSVSVNSTATATGTPLGFGYPARTLTLTGTNTGANTLAGILQDSAAAATTLSLAKSGTGAWLLSGTNTYSGPTTVNAGTLLVNGSLAAGSAVMVKTNATLGGSGTIGGSVTVTNGGNLAPGASVGMLSIGGGLNLSSMAAGTTGKLYYELGPIGASDSLAVAGTLTIGTDLLGFSHFAFANVGGLQAGTYRLITSGGINGSLDPADLSGPLGAFTGTLQINGNNLELVVTASVPLTPPVLTGHGTLAGTSFPLTFSGPSGQTYKVLSSTNVALPLTNWNVLTTGTFGTDPVNYTDTGATNAHQFYRIQSP